MFPSKKCLTFSRRLSVLVLAACLAGCSLNPFADDERESRAPARRAVDAPDGSASIDPDSGARTSAVPSAYEPKLVPMSSSSVQLADGHPNEYVVQPGDTLWDIASTFLRDP